MTERCDYCASSPALPVLESLRCEQCSHHAVDRAEHAPEPCLRVAAALRARGISITTTVQFELRTVGAMKRGIPGLPDLVHGITRTRRHHDGTLDEKVIITVRAGLPLAYFEAVVAHELVHVAIAEAGSPTLPGLIEEGLAEYVAWLYLTTDSGAPDARLVAERISQRRGDEYGEGFGVVARAAAREGFERTWKSIGSRRFRLAPALLALPGAHA